MSLSGTLEQFIPITSYGVWLFIGFVLTTASVDAAEVGVTVVLVTLLLLLLLLTPAVVNDVSGGGLNPA